MLRFANVATPETAAAVAVPESVPPPALGPSVTFTLPAKPVATLPSASWAVTCTAGGIAAPAGALVGRPLETNPPRAAALALKAPPVAVRLPPPPPPPAREAGPPPPPAVRVGLPGGAPPPGLSPGPTVPGGVKLVGVFPTPPGAVPSPGGVMGAPAVTLVGCTVNTSLF